MPTKNGNGKLEAGRVLSQTFDPRAERFPIDEIAEKVGVCRRVAYELLANGEIGHLRVGNKFYSTQSDIDAYLRSRYTPRERSSKDKGGPERAALCFVAKERTTARRSCIER